MAQENNPCEGGYISRSLQSYANKATAGWCSMTNTPCDSGCMPYNMGGSNAASYYYTPGTCISSCAASGQQMVTINQPAMNVIQVASNTQSVQLEISTNGPVSATISPVCDAFMTYIQQLSSSSTPYAFSGDCSSDPTAGGHAIQIVGWQTVGGVLSWKIRNSWGASAGYQGFFFLPIGNGPSSLGIISNVWTVLAGTQTAAGSSVTAAPATGSSTVPVTATAAAAGGIGGNLSHITRLPVASRSSDDDDFDSFNTGRSSFVIVDYSADASFAEHFETVRSQDLAGQTTRVRRPHHHAGVKSAIDLYLSQHVFEMHNVTRILWAGRQVVAGRLFKVLFNSVDSSNRTYVHKIVSHQPAPNNTITILSGLMVRTGSLESCASLQAAPATGSASSTDGYSGKQVAGIVVGSVAVSTLVVVALFLAFSRRNAARPAVNHLQESLLTHEND